jgi:hypothetical protein
MEFLQKKIKQLNVEFMATSVPDHNLNNITCLSCEEVFDTKRETQNMTFGKEQTKKQATAKEHVDMFLKLNLLLFLSLSFALVGVTFSSQHFDMNML